MSEEDGTTAWPRFSKKSRKRLRISDDSITTAIKADFLA